MPPASSPGSDRARREPSARERAARVRYRRALMLMTMTLVVPGSAQLAAGNRQVGQVALRIWLGLVAFAVAERRRSGWCGTSTSSGWPPTPRLLQLLRFVLMVLAVGWAALLVDAWRLGQPLTLSLNHRRAVVGRQRRALLLGRRHPAVRRPPRRRAARLHPDHVRGRRGHLRPPRPLQRAAARRRLRRRPLGPAARLDDGRQHRRGDRPHGARRAAPQHGRLPVRQGLGDGQAVPEGLRLRGLLPQRRQHLGPGPHRAVRQVRASRAWTPRSWPSRASPG